MKQHFRWIVMVLLSITVPSVAESQTRVELEGVISAISDQSFEMFDGRVRMDPRQARFDSDEPDISKWQDLRVGTLVEIDAVVTESRTLRAVEVEVSDEAAPESEIGGVIERLETSRFEIAGISIETMSSTVRVGDFILAVGQRVEANVVVAEGRLIAQSLELEEESIREQRK